MATADQVKALVKSHGEGDDDRFYSVAMQVAAKAARSGHEKFAQELRDLVDTLRAQASSNSRIAPVVPVAQPRGELAQLLTVSYPKARLSDLAISVDVKDRLKRIITEQRQRDLLFSHGYQPIHRVLLMGPPGTGKTLSANVLAGELAVPLFSIRLDGLITKYMGETAAKLRLIFDALSTTRGVYLFDEVDALAGERASSNDVGEIRRVLNSFLQFLELDTSESLIVAATNHPTLLDSAMFRRFDFVIQYPLPDTQIRRSLIANRLSSLRTTELDWPAIAQASQGLSHAEISVAVDSAAKDSILSGSDTVTTSAIISSIRDRSLE